MSFDHPQPDFWLKIDPDTKQDTGCAVCGLWFTHLVGVRSDLEGTPARRLNAYLDFECEVGCTYTVTFDQHKGMTTILIEDPVKGTKKTEPVDVRDLMERFEA